MAQKVKKEASAPPKAEAKTKAKKAALKGTHSHKERRSASEAKDTSALKAAQISWEKRPRIYKLDHYAIIKVPWLTDVKANKHWVKRAVKKLYDIDTAKVNALIRPDGEKKAYVQLAPNYELWMLPTQLGASNLSVAG
ncbi:60S ribosomal protein L23a-like [Artibeus jamaicensis]|uniref:60S ribosomal protein L23a-like n=1 Tax=Artibeus jamaicensis TaxID=9417 RepID=UPI00235AFB51|nr:60S ribosomal protein L23a-like [Artibeus jamaicensis]